MHTLMPGMVLRDGHPLMAVGTMGGDAQPQIHVQLLSAMLDFALNPQQAISAPRWQSGRAYLEDHAGSDTLPGQSGIDEYLNPNIVEVVQMESRFPENIPEQLTQLGHHIQTLGDWEDAMGHAQAIMLHADSQLFAGAADPRCDGLAMGY